MCRPIGAGVRSLREMCVCVCVRCTLSLPNCQSVNIIKFINDVYRVQTSNETSLFSSPSSSCASHLFVCRRRHLRECAREMLNNKQIITFGCCVVVGLLCTSVVVVLAHTHAHKRSSWIYSHYSSQVRTRQPIITNIYVSQRHNDDNNAYELWLPSNVHNRIASSYTRRCQSQLHIQ